MRSMGYILVGIFLSTSLFAQKSMHPRRTDQDIAHKQTEMLVRELNITDSVLRDTLFRLHLKYVTMRHTSTSRQDIINRMLLIQDELKRILSPEQFNAFMSRQLDQKPRLPQPHCNRIASNPLDTPPPLQYEEAHMPPPPPEHQPANRL